MSDNTISIQAETNLNENASLKIENGNMNLLGLNVKISDIIGDKLVDQFMATISPKQMEEVTKVLFKEVFETVDKSWCTEKEKKDIPSFRFKTEEPSSGWGYNRKENTTIYNRCKSTLIKTYSDMIDDAVNKYLESDEYKAKAEEIAKSIIDYALEGYKQDIITGIRKRLVEPVITPQGPEYSLKNMIQEEIYDMMKQPNY